MTVDTTQELIPEEETKIMALREKNGWLLYSPNEIKEESIPKEPAPEYKGDKTPGQRLRAVIYKFWELNTNRQEPFEQYYKGRMEKHINDYKERLN